MFNFPWGRLLPFDQKSPYSCNCSKPPQTATLVEIPPKTHQSIDSDGDDILLLDLSTESLYDISPCKRSRKVGTFFSKAEQITTKSLSSFIPSFVTQ